MSTVLNVILVILIIIVAALAVLYFLGRKLEKRQVEQQALMEAAAQTVSMLVIDKKKMKIKEANLPKIVYEQTPKYMRWAKVPVVKAKIGPKVMTLMADERVFQALPVKTEAKVVISGIYITEIKSVRGGAVPAAPKKKGFFARFKKNAEIIFDSSQNVNEPGERFSHLARFFVIGFLSLPVLTPPLPWLWIWHRG